MRRITKLENNVGANYTEFERLKNRFDVFVEQAGFYETGYSLYSPVNFHHYQICKFCGAKHKGEIPNDPN